MNLIKRLFERLLIKIRNREGYGIGLMGWDEDQEESIEAKHQEFLSYAAEKIQPCERSSEELVTYLTEYYQAEPCLLTSGAINALKANVLSAFYSHLLKAPTPLGKNPTKADIKEYVKHSNECFKQAREFPCEELGFDFRGYRIPTNIISNITNNPSVEEIIVEVEMKTKYISFSYGSLDFNGSLDFKFDLARFCGVNEEDIADRTPRFVEYAYALKHFREI